MEAVPLHIFNIHHRIKLIGYLSSMDEYESRKLGIFNLLNVLGFFIGILLPIIGLLVADIQLPPLAWIVTFSPAMISMLVLFLNYFRLHELGYLCYFAMYPVLTALVYAVSFDVGIELFFILYGVLSVFFLKKFIHIIFAFTLSLICYFYVFVFTKDYQFLLAYKNFPFYVLNHILPAGFIFYALFLIKKENAQYQNSLLQNYKELHRITQEVKKKNEVIDEKAKLLEEQTSKLTDLNNLKNKLFTVISHDLKTPLYALRNLFKSMQQYDLPAEEIKQFVPEVVNDLNYTTALMENLLLWVKSQMQIHALNPQILEVSSMVKEATDLLRLQAFSKQIIVESKIDNPIYIYADKDMVSLVLRNLLSNAIKFTGQGGNIKIGTIVKTSVVDIFVKDTGTGMDEQVVKQLFENNFYTTKGTANETGTGIGLMLCKDFLSKNGGTMQISSEPGIGSTFSFSLPRRMSS
jgi:signal transduction histidine kinase